MIMKKMKKQNLTVSLFLNRDKLYLKIMELLLYTFFFSFYQIYRVNIFVKFFCWIDSKEKRNIVYIYIHIT